MLNFDQPVFSLKAGLRPGLLELQRPGEHVPGRGESSESGRRAGIGAQRETTSRWLKQQNAIS